MRNICGKLQSLVPLVAAFVLITGCSKDSDDPTEIVVPEPPVQVEAELTMVYLGGIAGSFDSNSSTFSFVLPNVSNFKELNVIFSYQGDKVLLGTTDISKGAVLDLTSPVKVKVVSGSSTKDYTLVARNTGLPIVRITTPSSKDITSKETWMNYVMLRIENADGTLDYEGQISIRGRGNSTWGYPKTPYAIKLEKKEKILGMPKHKRWVLLANWKDRTLMRNDAAFWLSSHSGLPYTVRGQFVEVELNGRIMGNYFLCEQIKVDDNRVNITEMEAQEHDPEKLTGGYLVELDTYYDEVNRFHSNIFNLPYQFKEPDEETITADAINYFKNYISELETILNDEDRLKNHEYESYLDIETAIDFILVEELSNNTDIYSYWPTTGPHSVYMYKDKGGKLCHGPVWDFDYHAFVPAFSYGWVGMTKTLYYPYLLKDEKFKQQLKERWEAKKDIFRKLPEYIDETAEKIRLSEGLNSELWPITNDENGDEKMSFQEAVDRMKSAFNSKFQWMDQHIREM